MARTFLFVALTGSLLISLMGCATTAASHYDGERQSGFASWYGSENGHVTASGETFNPREYTAAHRHLPFGTIVRVTNRSNGQSVEVRINDRGPWAGDRIIDVSSAAADALQMKGAGIVPVEIEVLSLPSSHSPVNG